MTTNKHPNDFDIQNLEPIKVKDLLDIDSKQYCLVVWSNNQQAYVPYEFMKKHFPFLLLHFYILNSKFMPLIDVESS